MEDDQSLASLGGRHMGRHAELFDKHFPPDLDEASMVLKAHLLVEAALRDFCAALVPNPEPLSSARLRFAQVLLLAQALCPFTLKSFPGVLWTMAKHLNDLRNAMAHELEPDDAKIEKHKRVIVEIVNKRRGVDKPELGLRGSLEYMLGAMHGSFEVILSMHEGLPLERDTQ